MRNLKITIILLALTLFSISACSNEVTEEVNTVESNGCIISGCNGELCVEEGSEVKTQCLWRDEYSCLEHANCEIQDNGNCDWTYKEEYSTCLQEFRK